MIQNVWKATRDLYKNKADKLNANLGEKETSKDE